jgi:hypothetical protein
VTWIKAVGPLSQAEMVPFKLAKMKSAEPLSPPLFTGNDEVLALLTWPVGPWGPLAVFGIATVRSTLLTFVSSVTE